jgi:pullulanase/glycogen debranching enzyme
MIDHNSYNKDNETNYINYNHAKINKDLLNYYKGLIEFRQKYEAFRRAEYEQVQFFDLKDNPFAMGYMLDYGGDKFIVLFNAKTEMAEEFFLPEGEWEILVDANSAGVESITVISSKAVLVPSTGLVLKKR